MSPKKEICIDSLINVKQN